jgi:hypothetical protein
VRGHGTVDGSLKWLFSEVYFLLAGKGHGWDEGICSIFFEPSGWIPASRRVRHRANANYVLTTCSARCTILHVSFGD